MPCPAVEDRLFEDGAVNTCGAETCVELPFDALRIYDLAYVSRVDHADEVQLPCFRIYFNFHKAHHHVAQCKIRFETSVPQDGAVVPHGPPLDTFLWVVFHEDNPVSSVEFIGRYAKLGRGEFKELALRVFGSDQRHHIGGRASLLQQLGHRLHGRAGVGEEQLQARAQVVLARLAIATHAVALDVDLVAADDHDFRHRRRAEQVLQRPETEDRVLEVLFERPQDEIFAQLLVQVRADQMEKLVEAGFDRVEGLIPTDTLEPALAALSDSFERMGEALWVVDELGEG